MPTFQLVISNQHPEESVNSTTQKIYAKVTRPFFPAPTQNKKWSGNARIVLFTSDGRYSGHYFILDWHPARGFPLI